MRTQLLSLRDGRTVELRAARSEDVASIVELLIEDPLGATREWVAAGQDNPYERAFADISADQNQLLLVAVDADAVVATMQLSFIPGLARRGALRTQIEAVRVGTSHQSLGLGTAMFRWAIVEAAARGSSLVQLTTDKSRTDAHRFYDRLGFVASHLGYKMQL